MDNQCYGLIQEDLAEGQRCYCDDGFSTCWAQAKQFVLESVKKTIVENGVCMPVDDLTNSNNETKVKFIIKLKQQNKLRRLNKVDRTESVDSMKKEDKITKINDDSKWAHQRAERPSVNSTFHKEGKVSFLSDVLSLKNKRELLKKRHSDPTMSTTTVIPIRKPRSKSDGNVFKGIPSYVRKAWAKMSMDSSENDIKDSEIKYAKLTSRESASPNDERRSSHGTSNQSRRPSMFSKHFEQNSNPETMTYVEEREATLKSLRSTSISTKQTILQRVSIANGLKFNELRNKSNCFSKKAVSLLDPSNSGSSSPISNVGNSETLVDKAAKTFPLHLMMTTEDAIYGLSHSFNIARRNQHFLDKERLISEKSQTPDPRFVQLELALLRLNDDKKPKYGPPNF